MDYLRGDIFFINRFNGNGEVEKESGSPVLIVSNNIGNQHGRYVEVVYLTSKEKNPLPTHTSVMCRVPSTALCEQVQSVSKERLGEFIRSATAAEMAAVDECLKVSLALNSDNDEQNRIIENQGQQINTLVEANKKLQMQLTQKAETAVDDFALLAAQTERDTYKRLYENLLEKVMK